VLGWSYGPGSGQEGRQVQGVTPHHGLWGGQDRSTLFCCFRVEDVDAAVARVRAAGGTADDPMAQPYGRVAGCVDDQGVRFAVYEPPDEEGAPVAATPSGEGELAYVTLEVRESAVARAFYAAVLGWRVSPGHVEDGWAVDDALIGLHGGHEQATGVPMYRVDDIETAVRRVRAAGGTATDPATQPYGRSARCVDDQGSRFYLGQL
jgi:predicted enzyme related to lactoylglutathione lyase